ncbi:MAG: S1-like domain-containing RNA-binding protein [Lachnospiraceae bacterium]|nr:S1-like domain-containing RNA-binding protein [Lachnospiraceae bacterium]
MTELGKKQTMYVERLVDHGAYLKADLKEEAHILLPKNQLAEEKPGDAVEVFVYKDSEDRPIATKQIPALELGGLAVLPVVQVNQIGAFLDWGLAKNLFLPFREQTRIVKEGDSVLVSLYIDKSSRLCATMHVYDYLKTDSPYKVDDKVSGVVYDVSRNFGAFVAVDDRYSALIPKADLPYPLRSGQLVEARVARVLPDGKLTLSIREKAHVQMDSDAKLILSSLKGAGGFLPFNDKSDAEEIKTRFCLSKAAFKRAIGRLYKERLITIGEDGIRLSEQ